MIWFDVFIQRLNNKVFEREKNEMFWQRNITFCLVYFYQNGGGKYRKKGRILKQIFDVCCIEKRGWEFSTVQILNSFLRSFFCQKIWSLKCLGNFSSFLNKNYTVLNLSFFKYRRAGGNFRGKFCCNFRFLLETIELNFGFSCTWISFLFIHHFSFRGKSVRHSLGFILALWVTFWVVDWGLED